MVAAVLMLGGCVSTYVPPTATPTATVTFRWSGSAAPAGLAMVYDDRACRNPRRVVARSGIEDGSAIQRTQIVADRDVVLGVNRFQRIGLSSFACDLTFSFHPQAARNYLVETTPIGINCAAGVYRLDPSLPGGKVLEPTARREPRQCHN